MIYAATATYKSGLVKYGRTASFVGSRSQTEFFWEPGFKEVYESLNQVIRVQILRSTKRFEQAWRSSNADNDIPGGFDFTPYPVDEPYRFIQIRLGYDYRAMVIFLDGRSDAHWIHLFKKPGQKAPPKEIKLARLRAKDCWNAIKGSS